MTGARSENRVPVLLFREGDKTGKFTATIVY